MRKSKYGMEISSLDNCLVVRVPDLPTTREFFKVMQQGIDGHCTFTMATLAKKLGVDRGEIRPLIKRLQINNLLTKVCRGRYAKTTQLYRVVYTQPPATENPSVNTGEDEEKLYLVAYIDVLLFLNYAHGGRANLEEWEQTYSNFPRVVSTYSRYHKKYADFKTIVMTFVRLGYIQENQNGTFSITSKGKETIRACKRKKLTIRNEILGILASNRRKVFSYADIADLLKDKYPAENIFPACTSLAYYTPLVSFRRTRGGRAGCKITSIGYKYWQFLKKWEQDISEDQSQAKVLEKKEEEIKKTPTCEPGDEEKKRQLLISLNVTQLPATMAHIHNWAKFIDGAVTYRLVNELVEEGLVTTDSTSSWYWITDAGKEVVEKAKQIGKRSSSSISIEAHKLSRRQIKEDVKVAQDVNMIQRFFKTCCVEDPSASVHEFVLYAKYVKWTQNLGMRPLQIDEFDTHVSLRGFSRVQNSETKKWEWQRLGVKDVDIDLIWGLTKREQLLMIWMKHFDGLLTQRTANMYWDLVKAIGLDTLEFFPLSSKLFSKLPRCVFETCTEEELKLSPFGMFLCESLPDFESFRSESGNKLLLLPESISAICKYLGLPSLGKVVVLTSQ